jgi:hypothetical protein
MGEIVFGDRNIFIIVSCVGRLIRLAEKKRGKKMIEDATILKAALEATASLWDKYCEDAKIDIENSTANLDDFVEDTLAEAHHVIAEQELANA